MRNLVKGEQLAERWYLVFLFIFYFLWAVTVPCQDYAPDEYMRYEVSAFLYENNRFPVYEEQLNAEWGFSYAHMPTVLCHLLSYIPMKIVGIFSQDTSVLMKAARMSSVLCAVGSIYFLMKIAGVFFHKYVKWMIVIFVSMLPQFGFLAGYLNNDMPAVLGTSMICYAWVLVSEEKWNRKNALLLAVGIIVCALSYYNSYGWILCSMIFFLSTYLFWNRKDYKGMFRLGMFISVIVLCGISYFFIRQVILYGDLLGFKTQEMYGALYGTDNFYGRPFKMLQMSLIDMLLKSGWVQVTIKSFIACFGYLTYKCPDWVYYLYLSVFVLGIAGFVCYFIKGWKRRDKVQKIFETCILFNILLPVFLSICYSYFSDYQAQGRYLYPGIVGFAYVLGSGFEKWLGRLKNKKAQCMTAVLFCCADIVAAGLVFTLVYLPTI